ncbi:3-hydroxyacyl-CoA dehydrogenase NAD-binding domain-containing protein [Aliikangiella sp. IMCC44653]
MQSNFSQVILEKRNNIGLITIDYPPVNALSQNVRQGLVEGVEAFENDLQVKAIIITCKARTFIAGADIKEFGMPPSKPFLPDVVNRIEASNKPVVAAMFGTSLGGGFEVALACHYRVAYKNAKVGLPEVNLGLIPGAGGTQRLPRVLGVDKSIQMITTGNHLQADSFSDTALFDCLVANDKDLIEATIEFVEQRLAQGQLCVKRVGDLNVDSTKIDWQSLKAQVVKKARGKQAPVTALEVIENSINLSITEGMKIEREAFLTLRESEQSAALRHAFSAEKQANKTSLTGEPQQVELVGVVGGGNMGSGIATAFLNKGFKVVLVERNSEALAAGAGRINDNFKKNLSRGAMTQDQMNAALANLSTATEYKSLAKVDLVIEAIFEDLEVKKQLFSQLDKVCKKTCIFASNTSYLDINQIANSLTEPSRLVGMHFFSPAHIMKLLEVVKAEKSSEIALATAMNVGKLLGKQAVLVGVCFGFAGNRMYTRYGREVQQMLLEGASIEQIDQAMTSWGMAMGPLAVQDLSGIDIGHNARSAQPFPSHDPGYFRAAACMVEKGRLGRKSGMGFYSYASGKPQHDPEADNLIRLTAQSLNIEQRKFSEQEIVERALMALISEGLSLLAEGIVQRISDIDVIWLHGYGFPRHKGGPMFQAQQMGKKAVELKLAELRNAFGDKIWPQVALAPLK